MSFPCWNIPELPVDILLANCTPVVSFVQHAMNCLHIFLRIWNYPYVMSKKELASEKNEIETHRDLVFESAGVPSLSFGFDFYGP